MKSRISLCEECCSLISQRVVTFLDRQYKCFVRPLKAVDVVVRKVKSIAKHTAVSCALAAVFN